MLLIFIIVSLSQESSSVALSYETVTKQSKKEKKGKKQRVCVEGINYSENI